MSSSESQTLLERVRYIAHSGRAHAESLIPIDSPSIPNMLAGEMARMAGSEPGEGLVIIVDCHTAKKADATDKARAVADRVYVFGPLPDGWAAASNVVACSYENDITENDRFLVVLSTHLSLAVIGRLGQPSEEGTSTFQGGWTGQRGHVIRIAETLLTSYPDAVKDFPREEPDLGEHALAHAARLTTVLTAHLTSLQQDAAMDKNDLYRVLEILKAISSRRRCHDVLYVFVEQIARIVDVHRCSVVRIWGGADSGHVLASHDDESVNDLVIELTKYPEIDRAIDLGKKVVINDVEADPLTREFAEDLQKAGVCSILVIPIVLHDPNVGSLLLRATHTQRPFSMREIGFCEIVAEAASNALERAYLFESIQRANERLEHLVVTDGLTNLRNHRSFREQLDDEFERARRYGLPLSLVIFDVDDFKKINDSLGHLQGDSILREIARRTLQVTRKSDVVARYGGEEFAVIMPQTGLDGAQVQAERLRAELAQGTYEGMPKERPVTVSIGLAVLDHETMFDCEVLIRVADTALYVAKRKGKNRVEVGRPEGETV